MKSHLNTSTFASCESLLGVISASLPLALVHRILCAIQLDSGVAKTGNKAADPVAISRSRFISR
jgi:hypothetical protein